MRTVLYRAGRVLSPADPRADALVVAGGTIAWVGQWSSVGTTAVDQTVDLGGALVTPAFVDAHVHLTQTGLTLASLDLHGARSAGDILSAVADAARGAAPGDVLMGTGWDETLFADRSLPSPEELDRAGGGRRVYLSRADVHSALASAALLAAAGVGPDPDGLVRTDAHHAVRKLALGSLAPAQIAGAQRAALRAAARLGIGAVHEMAGPAISGVADLESALSCNDGDEALPEVVGYWGELGDVETPSRLGLPGGGGDLFCDGSLGSRTAGLHQPYADAADTSGRLYFDAGAVTSHVVACVRAGLQSGFHVIGDRAIDTVLSGVEAAAAVVGVDAIRAGRHRLEHLEMPSSGALDRIAALGLVASVQPQFDAAWGGPGGMYDERLGWERASGMNPLASFAAHGIVMAFGSDSPVVPFDPWGAVRAAVFHRSGAAASLTPKAAFAAHTRGGHRVIGHDDGGVLVAGAPASFAAWDAVPAPPSPPDKRVEAWATDPGWGDAGLPDLTTTPTCLATVVRGRPAYGGHVW